MNVADIYGYTALIKSAQLSDENGKKFSRQIIEAGASVNVMNMYGDTALFMALAESNYRCVHTLIEAGADVNAVKDSGNTALMAAVEAPELFNTKHSRYKSKMKCMELLLQAGAHVNKINNKHLNTLGHCVSKCELVNLDVFMLLFAAGETIDGINIENITWSRYNNDNNDDIKNSCVDFPDNFITDKSSELSLRHTCREAIRKHLMVLKPNQHLFNRIPQLGLPHIITKYLLYNMSLDHQIVCL